MRRPEINCEGAEHRRGVVPVGSDQVGDSEAALVADDGLTVDHARARATCAPALYIRQPVICVMRTVDDC